MMWGRMFWMKQLASKKVMTQPMDSPLTSRDSTHLAEPEIVELTVETKQPKKAYARTVSREKSNDLDSEESTFPLLPKEREANQPSIIVFFTKPSKKHAMMATWQMREGEEKSKEKDGYNGKQAGTQEDDS